MLDTVHNLWLEQDDQQQPHVVLLDAIGHPAGTAPKSLVHDRDTPLHQAFSCYVVRAGGDTLLTRRAATKRTWPKVWTNACCGHPRAGETLRQAVERHLADELGLAATRITLAVGDFAYRATMHDGTVEHELCPVLIAEVDGEPALDPDEADAAEWISWPALLDRVDRAPLTLSPWSVAQVVRIAELCETPGDLLDRHDPADRLLDVVPGRRRRWMAAPADQLDATRRRVDAHLTAFIDDRRTDVPEAGDAMAALHAAIDSLTASGGKRLRPAFLMWGHVAGGGDLDAAGPLDAAAAVELLHTFALLHDDVMDRSHTRRGRPTAQLGLRTESPRADDAEWFGISAAVLAGDLAFVWADRMFDRLAGVGLPHEVVGRCRELFTTLRTEVIAGQYLDIHKGCSPAANELDAARIALLKSARYTATRPLQIGAALAGAGGEVFERLERYGDSTGMAFQLRDDVLGVFGDPGQTGKSSADDLREGKRTLLVLRALGLTTDAGRQALERALGTPDLDEVSAQRCRDVIAGSGALASIEAAIDIHLERAVAVAETLDTRAAVALTDLAEQAGRRDR